MALCCGLLSSCSSAKSDPHDEKARTNNFGNLRGGESFVVLSPTFLQRATSALEEHLHSGSLLLEIRAEGQRFSVQLMPSSSNSKSLDGQLLHIEYVEHESEPGQPPIGRVSASLDIELKGKGELKENVFRFDEINLPKMARAFSVAKRAIDPMDGQIERLVVRRYLPFSERIRGRIFVRSPRMNGSIDVNEKGQPLKR